MRACRSSAPRVSVRVEAGLRADRRDSRTERNLSSAAADQGYSRTGGTVAAESLPVER